MKKAKMSSLFSSFLLPRKAYVVKQKLFAQWCLEFWQLDSTDFHQGAETSNTTWTMPGITCVLAVFWVLKVTEWRYA